MSKTENVRPNRGAHLPENWISSSLGEVSEKPQYGWTTKANHEVGELKLLRTTDITSGTVDWSTVPYCTEEPEDVEKYLVKSGDILISRAGSVGVSFLIKNPERAVFASYLIRFRAKEGVDPKYFYYYLKSQNYWAAIGASKSGIAVPNVNASKLSLVPIPIAPSNDQKCIVAEIEKQFSRLDEAVANLKRVKANLKRYKAAVLKAAVEGKLTEDWRMHHLNVEPASKLLERILAERRKKWNGRGEYEEPSAPETTDLPSLPKDWMWATVEQLSMLVQYGSSAKAHEEAIGVPVLRMGNIEDARLRVDSLKYLPKNHDEFPGLFLREGDILFNRTNSAELVGKTAVYKGKPNPCSFASYLIRVRLVQGCAPDLLAYFINSVFGRTWIAQVVSQQVGQANVNGTKLQALAVPLPPLDEQGQIVAEVERRLSVIDELEASVHANLTRADRLRQSILGQAFSGMLLFNGARG